MHAVEWSIATTERQIERRASVAASRGEAWKWSIKGGRGVRLVSLLTDALLGGIGGRCL